jgi:hypothetical protein
MTSGINSKSEYRNAKQIQNANLKCSKQILFLNFCHLYLFRASGFEFRIFQALNYIERQV